MKNYHAYNLHSSFSDPVNTDDARTNASSDIHLGDSSSTTAFSRPFSVSNKDSGLTNSNTNGDTHSIPLRPQNGAISVPPVKPYQPYNNSFDRPTYLPQFGISSYPDYVGHNATFGNGRLANYSEAYSQTFPSNPFTSNLSTVGGNYWSDGRGSHTFSDPYQHYNYNKLNATYDSLHKTTLLRNNAYQDSINRQALDSSRTYYRSPHENLQGNRSVYK